MRVDRTERLLNLLFCLMGAAVPVSREQIRRSVVGYDPGQSPAAFERMFERDKDELRGMGIPVDTVLNARGEVEGYRVSQRDYPLPPVMFTPAELTALSLAARAWESATLESVATVALRKVEAAAPAGPAADVDRPSIRFAPLVTESDAPWPVLLGAIRERRCVMFDYRKPGSAEADRREVEPWGVVSVRGAWYLVGFDRQRQDRRVFRLSRIVTMPQAGRVPDGFEVPDGVDIRSLVGTWLRDEPNERARLSVRSGRAQEVRRLGTVVESPHADSPEADLIEVDLRDARAVAALIASYGDAVMVLEPPWLLEEVRELLRGAHLAHGGPA